MWVDPNSRWYKQISALSPTQIGFFSQNDLNQLGEGQVHALTKSEIQAIDPNKFTNMLAALRYFTSSQVSALTAQQIINIGTNINILV